jgi:hypothetical protein
MPVAVRTVWYGGQPDFLKNALRLHCSPRLRVRYNRTIVAYFVSAPTFAVSNVKFVAF